MEKVSFELTLMEGRIGSLEVALKVVLYRGNSTNKGAEEGKLDNSVKGTSKRRLKK